MAEETSDMKETMTEAADNTAPAAETASTDEVETASSAESADGVSEEMTTDTADQESEEPESKGKWYVVHTYSGYENKVKTNLEKAIENSHLEDQIFKVRVPMRDVVEQKDGVRKTVSKKMFPGYVLINMIMNEDTWYVARNTRGVTGFVGPGSKPVPLSDAEMKALGFQTSGTISVDFSEGDTISVVAGVWKDTIGVVQRMDYSKQTATINVEIFGRDTPVEISFAEVKSMK